MQENRAYSLVEVKSLDEKRRIFSGVATSPVLDRVKDTINPLSAKFTNPLVLLWQHRSDQPIGRVTFKTPTKKGIEFDAEIPVVVEPGPLKDRVDTAWGEIAYGLVRGVSIGFRPTEKPTPNEEGGLDFNGVEIYELSTVSVPANAEANIQLIKSIDAELLAASGHEQGGETSSGDADKTDLASKAPRVTGSHVVKLKDTKPAKPFVIRNIKRIS